MPVSEEDELKRSSRAIDELIEEAEEKAGRFWPIIRKSIDERGSVSRQFVTDFVEGMMSPHVHREFIEDILWLKIDACFFGMLNIEEQRNARQHQNTPQAD